MLVETTCLNNKYISLRLVDSTMTMNLLESYNLQTSVYAIQQDWENLRSYTQNQALQFYESVKKIRCVLKKVVESLKVARNVYGRMIPKELKIMVVSYFPFSECQPLLRVNKNWFYALQNSKLFRTWNGCETIVLSKPVTLSIYSKRRRFFQNGYIHTIDNVLYSLKDQTTQTLENVVVDHREMIDVDEKWIIMKDLAFPTRLEVIKRSNLAYMPFNIHMIGRPNKISLHNSILYCFYIYAARFSEHIYLMFVEIRNPVENCPPKRVRLGSYPVTLDSWSINAIKIYKNEIYFFTSKNAHPVFCLNDGHCNRTLIFEKPVPESWDELQINFLNNHLYFLGQRSLYCWTLTGNFISRTNCDAAEQPYVLMTDDSALYYITQKSTIQKLCPL